MIEPQSCPLSANELENRYRDLHQPLNNNETIIFSKQQQRASTLEAMFSNRNEVDICEALSTEINNLPMALEYRNGKIFNIVTDFNADREGKIMSTDAIQNAIDEASKIGGAVVYCPPGCFCLEPLQLKCNVTLFLESQSILYFKPNILKWPLIPPLPSYGQGRDHPGKRYQNCISANEVKDVIITGNFGILDGCGSTWWKAVDTLENTRGHLLEVLYGHMVTICHIILVESPFWTIHAVYSNYIHIYDVNIYNNTYARNTDGITLDSSEMCIVESNVILTGDDAISLKSGWDHHGYNVGMPLENVMLCRNFLRSPRCAGICLGSEMSGGLSDINCVQNLITNSKQGINVKSAMGRGGYIDHVLVKCCVFQNVAHAISFNGNYRGHPEGYDASQAPQAKNFVVRNCCMFENQGSILSVKWIQNAPIQSIRISHFKIKAKDAEAYFDFTLKDIYDTEFHATIPDCIENGASAITI